MTMSKAYRRGEPIQNIQSKIVAMIEKYRRETIDIEDVEFEEYDLEEDGLLMEIFDKQLPYS